MFDLLTAVVAITLVGTTAARALYLRDGSGSSGGTEPGLSTYTVYAETSSPGSDNRYVFTLKKLSSGYRCYIDRTPSYRNRSTSLHVTHRLSDKRGKYICYTADLPYIAQARTLCKQWSDLTQRYIETGRTFES